MPITACTVFDCSDPALPAPVASFALDENGDGHFGYGIRYIDQPSAFPLDPVHLPLSRGEHLIARHQDGSYGVLSDAGPNAWGMKLTSSIFKKQGHSLPNTPVEWFLKSWHYGSGCLGFSEHRSIMPDSGVRPSSVSELNARLIDTIASLTADPDTPLDEETVRLFFPGSSLGGVRPKTVVMHEGVEHIAKFSRLDDRFDVPAAEYATLRLAHMAGISVPDFELIRIEGRSVLLVARFDRTQEGHRRHYMSANTLIDIDVLSDDRREYKTRYSYPGIAEAMRPINLSAREDSHELFRRMTLNIMVGNVDDHMRNHAFLMCEPGRFVLSPAFDIVPHLDAAVIPQSIGVGAHGPASTISNALSQCDRFLLKDSEARVIVEEVREAVSHWREVFRDTEISQTDIHTLTSCFSVADEAGRVQITVR